MATPILHKLPVFSGLAVLFLARHCLDVFRSQNRVMPHRGGWTCTAGRTRELRKYRLRPELRPYFDERDMICTIKQHVWQRFQRPHLERQMATMALESASNRSSGRPLCATLDFESFRTHPMWSSKEQRANLTIKRTAGSCSQLVRMSTPIRSPRNVQRWLRAGADAVAGSARVR